MTFAAETFIDEPAAAGVDPVQFRLRYLTVKHQAGLVKKEGHHYG